MLPEWASLPNQPRWWELGYVYCEDRWTSGRAVVFRRRLDDSFFNLLIFTWISFRLMPVNLWANIAWKSESDTQDYSCIGLVPKSKNDICHLDLPTQQKRVARTRQYTSRYRHLQGFIIFILIIICNIVLICIFFIATQKEYFFHPKVHHSLRA